MLIQDGGDRWADDGGPIKAAIAAALAEASDDEIREAFGMAEWRAVTPENRARYGEYFTPKVYRSIVEAMRAGVVGGKLSIRDFATFEASGMGSELFPVDPVWGPCKRENMELVLVTIAPGPADSLAVRGRYEGRWSRWLTGAEGQIVQGFPVEYLRVQGSENLFVVEGRVSLVVDYGGRCQVEKVTCGGLVVAGYLEETEKPGYESPVMDLVVTDSAPEIAGEVLAVVETEIGFGGPYLGWELGRPFIGASKCFSLWQINGLADKLAEGVLSAGAVHALDVEGLPLSAAAFVNCFPRDKWVVMTEHQGMQPGGSYGLVQSWGPVEWIDRAEWFARFGASLQMWIGNGSAVPPDLVGDRLPGVRVYAKFAPAVIEAINEVAP